MNGIEFTTKLDKVVSDYRTTYTYHELFYQPSVEPMIQQTSLFVFDFETQKLLCTVECKITDTNSIPEVITKNWFNIEQSEISYEMYSRILKLSSKSDGWRGNGSRKLEASSLLAFLNFWQKIKQCTVEPDLVLLPNGNLQVEWYKNDKHFFEIEFTTDQLLIFGLFDGKKEYEGIGSSSDVLAIAKLNSSKAVKWSMD